MVPPPAPARELHGCSVAILRLGAFTARARGACRVDSRWGSNPPSRASSARSHESKSVDPCSSKSHADPSRCPPFAVGQSVDPRSGKSHVDPSRCPPFADFSDVPNVMDAMRERPACASKFARASTPSLVVIPMVPAGKPCTGAGTGLSLLYPPKTHTRQSSSLAPANNGTLNSFVRRSGHAVKPTEKIRETLVASSTSAKRSAPEPPQGVPAPKRVFVSQEDDYDDNEDAPALEDVTE
ncbi:hypothetical protein EV424DRAFT_1532657 [Suillus variegatus]|nr:hypothetical protein EV424DRAFT_1532657 [Suillus variegatus]